MIKIHQTLVFCHSRSKFWSCPDSWQMKNILSFQGWELYNWGTIWRSSTYFCPVKKHKNVKTLVEMTYPEFDLHGVMDFDRILCAVSISRTSTKMMSSYISQSRRSWPNYKGEANIISLSVSSFSCLSNPQDYPKLGTGRTKFYPLLGSLV